MSNKSFQNAFSFILKPDFLIETIFLLALKQINSQSVDLLNKRELTSYRHIKNIKELCFTVYKKYVNADRIILIRSSKSGF